MKLQKLLVIVGPGILVAATGVGAGDLATGAFTGYHLGVAVLWAVVVGAFLKYVINEGLTRWQLATDHTLLEGCVLHLGRTFQWAFLAYLLIWSFLVGAALISACGATAHAMLPLLSPQSDKLLYGVIHSTVAVFLVSLGGYKLFEKVMTVCIGIMFVVVVCTAVALHPPLEETLRGLFWPTIPKFDGKGLGWTVALLGGVGGTLTVLCYGYWIREEGREGTEALKICRIDLATGYAMTALFGMSMLVIGSRMPALQGGGAGLLVNLADGLQASFGRIGLAVRWAFLVGAWGAVFSSLLGVWQSIPYLFADFWNLRQVKNTTNEKLSVDTRSRPYRGFLYAIAIMPVLGVWLVPFETAQKMYAVVGALIIPALAVVLLILNNRISLIGREFRNRWTTNLILVLSLLFFVYSGWVGIQKYLKPKKEPAMNQPANPVPEKD